MESGIVMVKPGWQKRALRVSDRVFFGSLVFFVIVCMGPALVIAVLGLLTGSTPTEEQGGFFGWSAEYPAFNPQSWTLFIPAAGMLFLSIWTIPLPLQRFPKPGRATFAWFAFVAFLFSIPLGTAYFGAPGIHNEGTLALFVYLVAWLLFVVRDILGWVHLVPLAWRDGPSVRTRRAGKPASADA